MTAANNDDIKLLWVQHKTTFGARSTKNGRRLRPAKQRAILLGSAKCCVNQGFQRLSKSAFVITLTELNAIAAPATTGLKYPSAAKGMPAAL